MDVLSGASSITGDLGEWLDLWSANRSHTDVTQLLYLISWHEDELTDPAASELSSRWAWPPGALAQVRSWIMEPWIAGHVFDPQLTEEDLLDVHPARDVLRQVGAAPG